MTHFTSSQDSTQEIPYGYCRCGCGQKTKIAPRTRGKLGWVKGEPKPYIHGHHLLGHRWGKAKGEAFWQYVTPGADDECWEWQGPCDVWGYGRVYFDRETHKAHRLSYEIHYGVDPGELCVCHSCDNPPCVNPYHLFLGTSVENNADRDAKMRHGWGERNGRALLVEDDVREIRQMVADGITQIAVAERFGVNPTTVHAVIKRRNWKRVK